MAKYKVLDLFSGIGGFSLGLEATGGFETVAFCEIDQHARKVLNKHWPTVPVYNDITTLKGEDIGTVDVICGGFPCQDLSVANRNAKGLDGERSGLWWQYRRIIEETNPEVAIIENVPTLRSRGLDEVLQSLNEIGYDAEWHCIPASFVGAWHKRNRIWILAYPKCISRRKGFSEGPILRQSDLSRTLTRSIEEWPGRSNLPSPKLCRTLNEVPGGAHRLKQLGNAVVPDIPEMIGYAVLEYLNKD